MKFEFDNNVIEFLNLILTCAKSFGVRVFFVGGLVRDSILNIKNDDIDLLIEGNAIDFSRVFPPEISVKSIHNDFGTIKAQYKDLNIDIASTRTETYPYSGCLPSIQKIGVKIEDDVKRRDFTVNSLYYELNFINGTIDYKLVDLVQGVKDIVNKTLRVLHDKSYIDDPTRILRGLNFKYRFGFDFSPCDKKLIKEYLTSIDSKNASYDRIYSVFYKNLKTKFGYQFFFDVIENGFNKIIFDEISPDFSVISDIISKFELKNTDLADFLISVLKNDDVEKINYDNLLQLKLQYDKIIKNKNLAYYIYKTGDTSYLKYFEIKDISYKTNGYDLIELGYQKGKNFKTIFDALYLQMLENPEQFKTKQDEHDFILKMFPRK